MITSPHLCQYKGTLFYLQYSCSPPPVFILTMALLQVTIFAYNSLSIEDSSNEIEQVSCSTFIFHPSRRFELWRYLTYMFIHSSKFHLVFNVLAQLALGIPLEMVHGKLDRRTARTTKLHIFVPTLGTKSQQDSNYFVQT